MSKKVLIVSLKAGAGHLKAAEALETAFVADGGFEVKNIDLLDYSSALIGFLYGKMYLDMVKAFPDLYSYNYKRYESAKNFIKPRLFFDKFNFSDFFKIVEEFKPDLIIATHFIPAAVLANYKEKLHKNYKIFTTLTDYEFHPLWLIDGVDLFFVATEEVKAGLIFYGIVPEKIVISGLPVHPKFFAPKNKETLRQKYSLEFNTPVILISAGSFGLTPLGEVIDELEKIKNNFQLIAVCGHNEKLKAELEKTRANRPRLKKVFGFVNFMDELMATADILITKPGGITVSEALTYGLPMILIEPIPGQEEANADYLLELGTAQKARNLPSLIYKIKKLLDQPSELALMAERTKLITTPVATEVIVDYVCEFLN